MERKFIVNPLQCVAAWISAAFLGLLAGTMVYIHRPGSALIFLALAVVFAVIGALGGACIHLDKTGVHKTLFGVAVRTLRWDEIAEVGVAGTRVFNRIHPEKTGSLYIYFSPVSMNENERFQMMLKWPPKDKLYLIYDAKRFHAVQTFWNQTVETYNTGNLHL